MKTKTKTKILNKSDKSSAQILIRRLCRAENAKSELWTALPEYDKINKEGPGNWREHV